MNIFIDTTAFRALFDPRDKHNLRALSIFGDIVDKRVPFRTSDYVIDETYTGLLTRCGFTYAMKFDQALTGGNWRLELITPARFTAAQEVFRKYNKDKKWSFTDCTSYVVMKELKIKTAFAFDKNFEEMGFKILN